MRLGEFWSIFNTESAPLLARFPARQFLLMALRTSLECSELSKKMVADSLHFFDNSQMANTVPLMNDGHCRTGQHHFKRKSMRNWLTVAIIN
jgi:hypothetical protein